MALKHLIYVPFTGLGLYRGFRGNNWLKNRIAIFKETVVKSLLAQTTHNFTLWISWRWEEKSNPQVIALKQYLDQIPEFNTVFTYGGVCFWDDKYDDSTARSRLLQSLHDSMGELINAIDGAKEVIMTIQPSDDCYDVHTFERIQAIFEKSDFQAVGYRKGYIVNWSNNEVAEYNPTTIPPFFSIRFPYQTFIDPLKHAEYTGPYKSHEYIADKLKFGVIDGRGFLVGTHGENISTFFNIPFKGDNVDESILESFGLGNTRIKVKLSLGRRIMKALPHRIRRKLRYWFGELLWQRFYV